MKRFFRLKFGEKFEVNEVVYQKETALTAVRSLGTREDWPGDAPLYLRFWPWTKVETCEFPVPRFIQQMRRDAKRFATSIARTFAAGSPFLNLVTGGAFPKGERIKATYNGISPFEHHNDDERTGPSA